MLIKSINKNEGRITLNRQHALNALNMELVEQLTEVLLSWRDDKAIKQVVICSSGRAFCSGGDLKMAYDAIYRNDLAFAESFFEKEYSLNALIHNYPKPYIAILNGITMGGGMGISIHGSHRIITENAMLCMPETSIGFFPDVGGTYFLNQCPGAVGMFLGLTSYRMSPADAMFSKLGTHYIESSKLTDYVDLTSLDSLASKWGDSYLEQNFEQINAHFGKGSLQEILTSLESSDTAFDKETRASLSKLSPSSLNVTFNMLHNAKTMTFDQAIATELATSKDFVRHPDFKEGIRAAVIDKDRKPNWA